MCGQSKRIVGFIVDIPLAAAKRSLGPEQTPPEYTKLLEKQHKIS